MNLLSVSEAKPQLGRLADAALSGQCVLIRRGSEVLQLVRAVLPEPVHVYPPGSFSRSKAEIAHLMATVTDDELHPIQR